MGKLFYTQPRLLILVLMIILVGGLMAVFTLPREEDPKITNRFPTIITAYPGATAERVEKLVSEKIENELRELQEIEQIRSTNRTGISLISVEVSWTIEDTQDVFAKIRDAVDDARAEMPAGVLQPIVDEERGYADTMLVALRWDAAPPANMVILRRQAEELQQQFRNLPGTELVTIYGGPEEEIRLTVDPSVLAGLGLTPADVARAIAGADSKVSAGLLRGRANEYVMEVRGELDSLTRLREVPLMREASGATIRVGDVARIERGLRTPPDDLALVQNEAAVVVAVRMASGQRVDVWTASARRMMTAFSADLSTGVVLDELFAQTTYTDERLATLMGNLGIGIMLVVAVLLVTLGWRAALVVTAAIPLTAFVALTTFQMIGMPIHQMSVTGMIVALGLLVDAAIVMTDAIQRRLKQGIRTADAVGQSVMALWLPLLASTITTVLSFLPITLMPGPAGEFVGPIATAVIIALLASLFLALTVIPAVAGRMLRVNRRDTSKETPAQPMPFWRGGLEWAWGGKVFRQALDWSLQHPWSSLVIACTPSLLGFVGMTTLTSAFFPASDRMQFHIQMWLPAQTSIYETREQVSHAYTLLEQEDVVVSQEWYLGRSAPAFYYNVIANQDGASHYAQAVITADRLDGLGDEINRLQQVMDGAFPQAEVLVRELEQGPPTFAPIELRLMGPDLDTLRQLGEQARLVFSQIPEVTRTRASIGGGEPKAWINADEDAAREAGLSLVDIAQGVAGNFEGVTGGSIIEGPEELPVRVRVKDSYRRDMADLAGLPLMPRTAAPDVDYAGLPVSALGAVTLEPSADTITRFNGTRANVISAYVKAGTLPATAVEKFEQAWAEAGLEMPAGYSMDFGGSEEARGRVIGALMSSVGIILTLMVATIVLSFNSFRLSAIVFAVAVLAMGLGLLSLTIGNFPFGFQPIVGLVGLIGVAINAAIIILTSLRKNPAAMQGDVHAIRDEVMVTSRHIISTTITTLGGFLPLILTAGDFWPPFATAIAGGVALSTAVSFFFVPQSFLLLRRVGGRREAIAQESLSPAE